jgi:hypothetical protein
VAGGRLPRASGRSLKVVTPPTDSRPMEVSRTSTIAAPSAAAPVTRSTRHRFLARPAAWVTAHPLVALATIVLGSLLARLAAAFAYATPSYFQDEYVYSALARSIAHGQVTIRGGSASFPALVDPLLTSLAWLQNDPEVAYRITQSIHALAISLAAVPVYLLGRRLALPLRDTLLAAAATVALPSFVFSAYVTADALGVTLALCAVLAGVVAIERPTARTQSAFLFLAVVATLTRVQYVFLPAAFIVAALVVERGNLRSAARAFRPTLIVLAVLMALTLVAGPHRLVGLYGGIFEFHIDLTDIGRWVAVNIFLLALATGAVVLPGAIGGLVGALGRRAGRAERGFAAFAIVSLLALLLEAAIFSANGTHGFFERYLMLAGPLLVLGLCLVARSARGRIFGIAAGAVLLVALMRLPLSGYAAEGGKRDSPLLGGVFWLEDRFGIGGGAQLVAFSAAGLILCSIVLLKVSKAVVPICLVIAIAAGAAASFAATSFDVARSHDARTTFLPADPSWVDHANLGPATMLLASGDNPPVASTHLFWNTSLEHVALLEGGERIDSFATGKAVIAADGTVEVGGVPVNGPVLVEEYAAAAQLEHARLITRTTGTSLWLPVSQARIASLTEGLYLDGWLSYPSRIRVWPSSLGGTDTMRFTLSLPANAPTQTVEVKGAGSRQSVVVPAGGETVVTLDVDRSRLTELRITCKSALQVGGNRVVCAQATVPVLTPPNSVSS